MELTLDSIRDILKHTAKRMSDLADRVDDLEYASNELTKEETELLRIATLPYLTEQLDMIKFSYLSGSITKNIFKSFDEIKDLFNFTS